MACGGAATPSPRRRDGNADGVGPSLAGLNLSPCATASAAPPRRQNRRRHRRRPQGHRRQGLPRVLARQRREVQAPDLGLRRRDRRRPHRRGRRRPRGHVERELQGRREPVDGHPLEGRQPVAQARGGVIKPDCVSRRVAATACRRRSQGPVDGHPREGRHRSSAVYGFWELD